MFWKYLLSMLDETGYESAIIFNEIDEGGQ
jgi:hypothetical protein